jgi:hypothetical protein
LVNTFEQTNLAELVDWEAHMSSVRKGHDLGRKVNGHFELRFSREHLKQATMRLRIRDDWQQVIFQGVVEKNIGERGADDSLDAPINQSPGGMLP